MDPSVEPSYLAEGNIPSLEECTSKNSQNSNKHKLTIKIMKHIRKQAFMSGKQQKRQTRELHLQRLQIL